MVGSSVEPGAVTSEPEVESATEGLCPMCGVPVPEDAVECPSCEEPFSPEAFEKKDEAMKRSKLMFFIGVILVLLGGPGFAGGSYLHDLLKIPIGHYDAFEVFGWVNQLVATVGIIILVIGILFLLLSLPRLSIRPEKKGEARNQENVR